jgi:hypothetical protein
VCAGTGVDRSEGNNRCGSPCHVDVGWVMAWAWAYKVGVGILGEDNEKAWESRVKATGG